MKNKISEFFKNKRRIKYRIQVVEYFDEKPTEYYPQKKEPNYYFWVPDSWEYFYDEKGVPCNYEKWIDNLFAESVEKTVVHFSTEEEAYNYIKEQRKIETRGVKNISVKTLEYVDNNDVIRPETRN